jgi:hypothetical protein
MDEQAKIKAQKEKLEENNDLKKWKNKEKEKKKKVADKDIFKLE